MPPPNRCRICGLRNVQELGPRENQDIFGFRCERCGRYELTEAFGLHRMAEELRMRISVATRQADVSGSQLVIDAVLAQEIVERQLPRRPLLETADIVLLYLADLAPSHFATIESYTSHDHTLLGFVDERGMLDALNALKQLGRLEGERAITITLDGWRRIEELRREQPNSRKAFVAMWFADEMEVAWTEGFEPGIRDTEFFEPVRMLDIEHAGKIDNRIIAEIRTSGLLVADFTGDRGGVYYEAGFAAGLGIPVIWCCREDYFGRIHFDTRQYNHILWTEPSDLREKLKNRILAVVPAATKR